MEKAKVFEMPPPLPSDSDDDRSEEEIYLPVEDIQHRGTMSSTKNETEARDAQHGEEAVNGLGHHFGRLSLRLIDSVEGDTALLNCEHHSKPHPDVQPSQASDERDQGIITEEDVLMFQSTMQSIEAGIDPQIGSLTAHDIACLNHDRLLNDEIINAYMQLLQKHRTCISCHFFNSFFLPRLLTADNYQEMKNWTLSKRLKRWGQSMDCILDVDCIFLPYFAFVHWSLIVVDLREDAITLYDSIMPVSKRPQRHVKQAMQSIGRYLMDEAKDKKQEDWSERVYSFRVASPLPQQENGSDCGVFMVQYAKCLSMDMPLSFSQGQIYDYRIQMFRELLHDRIL